MVHASPKSQVGFKDLPLDHAALLNEIRSARDREECHCQVLSEVHEAAVQRLMQYSRDSTRGYANARFLNLTETGSNDGPAKSVKCQSEVTAHAALRSMVEDLTEAFEKQNIDMTVFKPNQFAALSVYYTRFLRKNDNKPQNGIAKWCFGFKTYVSGEDIEPEAERQEHLASNCLPSHYDCTGVAQPGGLNVGAQAIAAAPVTCELCHVGLAGHDKLKQHCDRKHCGLAE